LKADINYYKRVFKEIETGKLSPVYLFMGSERYLMEEALQRLIRRVVSEDTSSFNLTASHAKDIDIEDFISSASSFPFLADKKVCVLKDLEQLKGKWQKLIDYCARPVPSTVLVILFNDTDEWGRRVSANRNFPKLVSAVRRSGTIVEFGRLSEGDLVVWVKSKLKSAKIRVSDDVALLFVRSVGDNLFELKNEIDKMVTIYEESGTLDRENLNRVLGAQRVETVYNFLDNLVPGKEKEALESLLRVLSSGLEHPSRLLYRMIRHFMSLLKIKAGLGGNDYRTRILKKQADKFSVREVLIWLENLRQVDIIMKSSSFPEDELLIAAFGHSMNGCVLADTLEGMVT